MKNGAAKRKVILGTLIAAYWWLKANYSWYSHLWAFKWNISKRWNTTCLCILPHESVYTFFFDTPDIRSLLWRISHSTVVGSFDCSICFSYTSRPINSVTSLETLLDFLLLSNQLTVASSSNDHLIQMFDLCISNESPCWETFKFKLSARLNIPVKNGERCISSNPEMIFNDMVDFSHIHITK